MKNNYAPLIFLFFFISFICLHAESTGNIQQQTIENSIRINELDKKVDFQVQQLQNETDKKIASTEARMEIKKENIEYRSGWITIWLTVLGFLITVFGVVIPIGGFFYGRKFLRDINQDLDNQKIEARDSLQQFINDSKERMALLEKEACSYIEKLKSYEADGKEHSNQLQELLTKALNPNLTIEEKAEFKAEAKAIVNNKESSPYEKDMAEALVLYFTNKYQEALEKYLQLLQTYPQHITLTTLAKIYFRIAYVYTKLNSIDNAIEYYKRAVEINPKDIHCLCNYAGLLQRERQEYDKAEELYKKAIDIDRKSVIILGNYAFFLQYVRKDYNRADEYYKLAIELDPTYANALENYAVFLQICRKDYDRAEEMYIRAIKEDSKQANTLANYAHFLILHKEDFEAAAQYINQAFKINNKSLNILSELWFYRFAHYPQWYDEAEKQLETLIAKGAKSIGWNLQDHITIAAKNGHPKINKLKEFAKVITE